MSTDSPGFSAKFSGASRSAGVARKKYAIPRAATPLHENRISITAVTNAARLWLELLLPAGEGGAERRMRGVQIAMTAATAKGMASVRVGMPGVRNAATKATV